MTDAFAQCAKSERTGLQRNPEIQIRSHHLFENCADKPIEGRPWKGSGADD
jgi:hypothetical protein